MKDKDIMNNSEKINDKNVVYLAKKIRLHVLNITSKAGSSHVGSNFSISEILAVLYELVLNINPKMLNNHNRDRFILSKGHAAASLYAVLAEKGFFPLNWLETFYMNDTSLSGHATSKGVPGIELSTGSLGHGLSVACGIAYSAKLDKLKYRVWTLLSDGECDEGSVWEAALFASHHKLDNLIVIVDYNKIQSLGQVSDVVNLEPFAQKWRAFGWSVYEVDGHNIKDLKNLFLKVPLEKEKPTTIIAHTIKGKGVSFMENSVLWHYRTPKGKELEESINEIKGDH